MKKLMFTVAVATLSLGVFAQETAPAAKPAEAVKAVEPGKRPPRQHLTREQVIERMQKRNAERKAKLVEILKAAGVAEEKVAGLADEIDRLYGRMPRMPHPPRQMRPAKPAAEGEKK